MAFEYFLSFFNFHTDFNFNFIQFGFMQIKNINFIGKTVDFNKQILCNYRSRFLGKEKKNKENA